MCVPHSRLYVMVNPRYLYCVTLLLMCYFVYYQILEVFFMHDGYTDGLIEVKVHLPVLAPLTKFKKRVISCWELLSMLVYVRQLSAYIEAVAGRSLKRSLTKIREKKKWTRHGRDTWMRFSKNWEAIFNFGRQSMSTQVSFIIKEKGVIFKSWF